MIGEELKRNSATLESVRSPNKLPINCSSGVGKSNRQNADIKTILLSKGRCLVTLIVVRNKMITNGAYNIFMLRK